MRYRFKRSFTFDVDLQNFGGVRSGIRNPICRFCQASCREHFGRKQVGLSETLGLKKVTSQELVLRHEAVYLVDCHEPVSMKYLARAPETNHQGQMLEAQRSGTVPLTIDGA